MTERKVRTELSDADHEEILNNPAADTALAKIAVERAIARGISREDAEALYSCGGSVTAEQGRR